MLKTAVGVAGGISLAGLVVMALVIAAAVAPSFVGFMKVMFADTGFQIIVGVATLVGGYYYFVVRRTGRWL